jgi:nitrate/nitrite transport system substrate-binding protein
MTTEAADVEAPGDPQRRTFIQVAGAMTASALMGMVPGPVRSAAWAAGSDAPEKSAVRIGFMPLADCASVVMAAELGLDAKYGLKIVPEKQMSWASVRDRLLDGETDAAHVLYGLVYGVHLGIGGRREAMAVLATINRNGQAITLSRALHRRGVASGGDLKASLSQAARPLTFAQTFPTGTHAMWLYYWLAAHGIDPFADVRTITVPPPQMVATMRAGDIDGFCVGEPWNQQAIVDGIGFTAVTSQSIWPDHPEKVLGTTAAFAAQYPHTARAMTAAIVEAGRWLDASPGNRARAAGIIADARYVDTDQSVILARMQGRYENGLGSRWNDPHAMKFYDEGAVSFPYLSDGMWFMTQQHRWGLLRREPDYAAVAAQVQRLDVYRDAAAAASVPLPASAMRASRLIDGVVWDGSEPARYAAGFPVHA